MEIFDEDYLLYSGGTVLVVRQLQRSGGSHLDTARGTERPQRDRQLSGAVGRLLRRHHRPPAQLRTLQYLAR